MKKSASPSQFTPAGWHTVTPRIVARDAKELVGFLRKVFHATGRYRQNIPTELRVGDSIVMVSEAGVRKPSPAFLYVYVSDVDTTFRARSRQVPR